MKVLFVLGFPNPFPGAAWTRIGFLAEAWSKRGHSIEVLGTFGYTTLQKRGVRKFDNVNIFNLLFNMRLNHPLVFTLNSIISFIVVTLFLLTRRPDIIIVSVPPGDVGLGALVACRLIKVKHVVDYRDEWEDRIISLTNSRVGKPFFDSIKKLMARLYVRSYTIVAVTPNIIKSLKWRGVTNVKLIPNGADIETFKPYSEKRENKTFKIFYSGGVGGYYRLDVAVKSVKKLVDMELKIKLNIAGNGEVWKVLNLARELGILNNIEYKGSINDKVKLAHLIAEADVGLIPYDGNPLWRNSLSAKFFEYCSCGIPVIATVYEDSLLAMFIREHGIGVTSPPMDEEKLAEAVYRIYMDKPFREEAGKRARLLIEEKFDRNKIAEEFLIFVETLP